MENKSLETSLDELCKKAYQLGQEDMRERAAVLVRDAGMPLLGGSIRALPIKDGERWEIP